MKAFLGFLTLVAVLVFGMGLVKNAKGTAQVTNAGANGLVKLYGLELGVVPKGA